jgi:hypothetical protein
MKRKKKRKSKGHLPNLTDALKIPLQKLPSQSPTQFRRKSHLALRLLSRTTANPKKNNQRKNQGESLVSILQRGKVGRQLHMTVSLQVREIMMMKKVSEFEKFRY